MGVKRRFNFLGQMRVDVPHLKSIESAISNDFDELMSSVVTGVSRSYVVRGFEINMSGAIGASANGLQLLVEDSAVLHNQSSVSGTFLITEPDALPEVLNSTTNTKVAGSFTPNTQNYIGIEFTRTVDDSTADQVAFWNPTTESEITRNVPLALILDYEIRISTTPFGSVPNVLPIATILTDAANNVLEVEDNRPLLYRLGTAGADDPNPAYVYPWDEHDEGRTENPSSSSSSTISPFRGGDKQIYNLKDWMDAVMSQFLEIKGTPFWYSPNTGGSIVKIREDVTNSAITGRGSISHDEAVSGKSY